MNFTKRINLTPLQVLTSTGNDEWATPPELFNRLDSMFHFTLDACCTKETAKCKKFYTKDDNTLIQSWKNEIVFMNPPYSRNHMKHFIRKAYEESEYNNALVVALIPSRTDTKYYHNYCKKAKQIIFLKGRVKFLLNGKTQDAAPFPSMLVIWQKEPLMRFGLEGYGK